MGVIRKSAATLNIFVMVVACGHLTNGISTSGTTVTIHGDSEWQIPHGFSVVPTPTPMHDDDVSTKYMGVRPDIPEFSMTRDAETGRETDWVSIAVWADGVSADSDAKEVLMSWTEKGIRLAEYDAIVVTDRVGIQVATWRGQAQAHGQAPQGLIVTTISDIDTQRVWRLVCFVTSEEVSDEVARICDQVQAEFRPL